MLLGRRASLGGLAQVLATQTAALDAGGNFTFANLPPNTVFTLTIRAPDGRVLVQEVVTTPGAGALRFVRSSTCVLPLPLLPPPPPLIVPPPALVPLPLLPAPAMAAAPFPEVPVIPEADSILLLIGGLTVLGTLAGYRRWRGRKV